MGKKKEEVAHTPLTVHDGKPANLEGWLEKKGHNKVTMGETWQKRYMRIDEATHSVVYAKSSEYVPPSPISLLSPPSFSFALSLLQILFRNCYSPAEKPSGSFDLLLLQDVTVYEKNGKQDLSRFNIDLGDKVYKFRASSEADGRRWVDGLNAWRDFFLLNM